MIEFLVGTLGAGKTYSAVDRWIAPKLGRGGTVSTNIELNWCGLSELVAKRYNVQVEREQLVDLIGKNISDFHKLTPAGVDGETSLIVLDESQLDFNARNWNKTSEDLLSFLTQSRKHNTDVVFITQAAENVDKQFRRLAQFYWTFRDMSKWTLPGLGLSFPALAKFFTLGANDGQYILACQWDYDGKTLFEKHWVRKDPLVFHAYNTKALVRSFARAGVAERKTLKQVVTPLQRRKRMVKFLFVAVLLGAVAVMGLSKASPFGPAVAAPDSKVTHEQKVHTPARQSPRAFAEPPEKKQGAYDIYAERFVGWDGEALRTDLGWYRVGDMSARGFVVASNGRVVRVQQPDGRTGWVVAQEMVSGRQDTRPVERPELAIKNGVVTSGSQPAAQSSPSPVASANVTRSLDMRRVRAGLPPVGDERMANAQAGLPQH